MVYTPEETTDVSPSLQKTPTTSKKPSDRKSLCLFTNIFDVRPEKEKRRIGATDSKT